MLRLSQCADKVKGCKMVPIVVLIVSFLDPIKALVGLAIAYPAVTLPRRPVARGVVLVAGAFAASFVAALVQSFMSDDELSMMTAVAASLIWYALCAWWFSRRRAKRYF